MLNVHFDHALDRVCQYTTFQSATAAALLDLSCCEVATESLASLNVALRICRLRVSITISFCPSTALQHCDD